jgi:hypothetical protein
MKKSSIATVINFCSNEARFLPACIEQCRYFSNQIIIPVCDHFFDGAPENRNLLNEIYASFPDCQFIEYPFAPHQIPPKVFKRIAPEHFWHSASRALGFQFVNEGIKRVLFLDADEVPEGEKFCQWLEAGDFARHSVLKLSNYWYFREPSFRADQWEDSIILAHKASLKRSSILHVEERNAIYDFLPNPKQRKVVGSDGLPMFHHFSWVRTKEEMIQKIEKWGHRDDRDWKGLVEEEFSAPFKGKDFIHGYNFKECASPFDLSMDKVSFTPSPGGGAQVHCLGEEELLDLLGIKKQRGWKNFFNFRG